MRSITRLVLLFAAIVVTQQAASSAVAAEAYAIDVILPLTGGASFLGKGEQQALQVLEKNVNQEGGIGGRQLSFVYHDDQSSPQVAVQLISQILPSHPPLIFGSAIVAMCNAMAPLVSEGPFTYCFSPGIHPEAGSYVFTSNVSTYDVIAASIRYYRLKGWKKLAIITSTDATGQDAEKGILEALAQPENAAMQLVNNAHFNPSDATVAGQIERIKEAKPDVLIAWNTGAAIATVFKAIIQADLEIPIATGYGNMTQAQMAQYAGILPQELYFASTPWMEGAGRELGLGVAAAHDSFFNAFRAAGLIPDISSVLSWDPAIIMIDALRKLGPSATSQQLRDYVAKLQGYAGVNGVYDFPRTPQRGLDESASVISLWNPSKKLWEVVSAPRGIPLGTPKGQ